MKVHWTLFAEESLDRIAAHIRADNPRAALRVAQRLMKLADALGRHPRMGVAGRAKGTRELIDHKYPYIIMYRIEVGTIAILRVSPTKTLNKPGR